MVAVLTCFKHKIIELQNTPIGEEVYTVSCSPARFSSAIGTAGVWIGTGTTGTFGKIETPKGHHVGNRHELSAFIFDWFVQNLEHTIPLQLYTKLGNSAYNLNPHWTYDYDAKIQRGGAKVVLGISPVGIVFHVSELAYFTFKLQWGDFIEEIV